MPPPETTALAIYMRLGFKKLNSYLRIKSEQNPKLDLLEKLTNQALDKIANSKRLVYRTTRFYGQPDMPEPVSGLENRNWGDKVGAIADPDGHVVAFACPI